MNIRNITDIQTKTYSVSCESSPRICQLGAKDSPNHTQESHETRSNLTCETF
ncbi:hypothetical protein J6590_024328 [Homalodisca vitripennis]|nr:hypothetical protein J6590_024328 [Homalodisca vitripennis]